MASSNWFLYGPALEAMIRSTIDMDSNAFRMVLVGAGYTPNQLTDDAWSDISANEVANGNGYATHGKLVTVSVTRSGLVVTVDGDDQTWANATITAKWAVIVKDADANGALAAGDVPLCYCELQVGGTMTSTNGPFTVPFNAAGAVAITAATAS